MEQITQVDLTPDQQRKWEETAALMVWACPGFRHLWYKLLVNHNGKYAAIFTEYKQVPIAATDGKNILIRPSEFFQLPLRQRTFVCAHEVVHNVYDDPSMAHRLKTAGEIRYGDGKVIPYDGELVNQAMDYRINDLLISSRIGEMPTGKWKGFHDQTVGKAEDSMLDIYRKLYEDGGGSGPNSQGPGSAGPFDVLMPPGASTGQSPHQATENRNPSQWASELQVAKQLEAMKAQGNMSAGLMRMFDEILNPKVPWTEHIRGFAARRLGSGSFEWRKPDRRLITRDIYAPGRSGFGTAWVAVFGDVSGSIGTAEMSAYLGELSGIVEDIRPKRLTAVWFERGISRVDDEIDANDLARFQREGVPGGGGTDVRPCFDWVDEHNDPPDAVVVLTDGLTPFPAAEPRYPVIWALTHDVAVPFGEKVMIL